MKKIFFFFTVFMMLFTTAALASEKISPALDVIAEGSTMIKSAVTTDGELNFEVGDFDAPLLCHVSSIVITELPSKEAGYLMLDNLYVVENQVIYREDFDSLRLVSKNASPSASFKFKPNNQEYEIECALISLKEKNLSPTASNGIVVSASTIRNIACSGTLLASDPEGEELIFEITKQPKKGLVSLTNINTGDYVYTPYENKRGRDSFCYRVRDSHGNYSDECKVEIKIERKKSSFVFNDVENTDLCAVISVCESGIMEPTVNADKTLSFSPDKEITREEFIYLVMRTLVSSDAPTVEKTRFADDCEITDKYKGYLESAFSLGIIEGTREHDGVHIRPKDSVTLAEGAVIINNIIKRKSDTPLTVFSDSDEIPVWAKEDIDALCAAGIIKKDEGKISPNSPLTRAQVAQIIMALIKLKSK